MAQPNGSESKAKAKLSRRAGLPECWVRVSIVSMVPLFLSIRWREGVLICWVDADQKGFWIRASGGHYFDRM